MARGCKFWIEKEDEHYCTIHVANTNALVSNAVTAKLICAFVFAYAYCWFSDAAAHLVSISLYLTVYFAINTAKSSLLTDTLSMDLIIFLSFYKMII